MQFALQRVAIEIWVFVNLYSHIFAHSVETDGVLAPEAAQAVQRLVCGYPV